MIRRIIWSIGYIGQLLLRHLVTSIFMMQHLTLNLLSKAFYPWRVDKTNGRIHGVVAARTQGWNIYTS